MTLTRESELWACALAIARQHGKAASRHAGYEIDRLDADGEPDAAMVWREVLKRIEALERGAAALQ
jgi:hypothetical protein